MVEGRGVVVIVRKGGVATMVVGVGCGVAQRRVGVAGGVRRQRVGGRGGSMCGSGLEEYGGARGPCGDERSE